MQGPQPSADAALNGTLVSSNCGLKLAMGATTFRQEVYYAKAVNYTLLITTLSFLQVGGPKQAAFLVFWGARGARVTGLLLVPGTWWTGRVLATEPQPVTVTLVAVGRITLPCCGRVCGQDLLWHAAWRLQHHRTPGADGEVTAARQVLMLIRQMEATSTQALAASVSLLCIGHQAILDAYLCLLHLTTGARHRPPQDSSPALSRPLQAGWPRWKGPTHLVCCVCTVQAWCP